MGLLIADDINQRNLATYIPNGSICYSACSFIFLAGTERMVTGRLGVHQISSDSPDLVGAQLTISDIIDVLNRFDTPVDVMSVMFKTPPDEIHIFTPDEIERYKLNRSRDLQSVEGQANDRPKPSEAPTSNSESASNLPTVFRQLKKELSPREDFTKRPNRVAIYAGLDFFGDDISAIRTGDAGECAKNCLAMNRQCKAFTFNANPVIKRGPNCFLKGSAGRADGNSVAFSGLFLGADEDDPEAITLGTIDPQTALYEDVDLPGGDLSRHPHRSAKTPIDCRLACIDDRRCVAFTYVKTTKDCWLKGSVGTPVYGRNMVSGLKKLETFSPKTIVNLD